MRTSEELHALHRELWGWLAETGERRKQNWTRWNELDDSLSVSKGCLCFACQEARERGATGECNFACPISWVVDQRSCLFIGSPYSRWVLSDTKKGRKKYAAIIRDLPWSPRPEVKA